MQPSRPRGSRFARYTGILASILFGLNLVYRFEEGSRRDPAKWFIAPEARLIALGLPKIPGDNITDNLRKGRRKILLQAQQSLGQEARSTELRNLSAKDLNSLMAVVFDGDRDNLEILGINGNDMARLRDVHLKLPVIRIRGEHVAKLGSRKVFRVGQDYGISVKIPDARSSSREIPLQENAWGISRVDVEIPNGITAGEIRAAGRIGSGKVLIAHRGSPVAALGIPENSIGAIVNALGPEGLDAVELDIVTAKDGRIVIIHDLNGWRVAGLSANRKVYDMDANEIVGQRLVLREVRVRSDGEAVFTGKYSNTEQHVPSLESVVDLIISKYPHAVVYLDCRMRKDTGPTVAQISRCKEAWSNFSVKIWYFGFLNAGEVEDAIEAARPDDDWKKNVKIVPMIDGVFIEKLCNREGNRTASVKDMVNAGCRYFRGFFDRGFNVVQVEVAISGLGNGYSQDESGEKVRTPDGKRAFRSADIVEIRADYALMKIAEQMRKMGYPILTSFRTGDFLNDGDRYRYVFPDCTEIKRQKKLEWLDYVRSRIGEAQKWGDYAVVDFIQPEKVIAVCRVKGILPPDYNGRPSVLDIK